MQNNMDSLIESSWWVTSWNQHHSVMQNLVLPSDMTWVHFAATIGNMQYMAPWIAPPRPQGLVPIPLQLPTGLRSFKWVFRTCTSTRIMNHPIAMAFDTSIVPPQHQIQIRSNLPAAWIIFNNPLLESIELETFQCLDAVTGRSLIRGISSLRHLKKLKTFNRVINLVPDRFILAFLKSLPLSIESVQLDFCTNFDHGGIFNELAAESDSDADLPPLVERAEPFTRLTELMLPRHFGHYTADQVDGILQKCPALERLVLPQNIKNGTGAQLANMIRIHCPNVRNWSIIQPMTTQLIPHDGPALLETLNNLPPEQMARLS